MNFQLFTNFQNILGVRRSENFIQLARIFGRFSNPAYKIKTIKKLRKNLAGMNHPNHNISSHAEKKIQKFRLCERYWKGKLSEKYEIYGKDKLEFYLKPNKKSFWILSEFCKVLQQWTFICKIWAKAKIFFSVVIPFFFATIRLIRSIYI